MSIHTYPAIDVTTISNTEGKQQPFFLSLQNVHYIETQLAVSPSRSVAELWLNTGEKTHILIGRGALASPWIPLLVSLISLPLCPSPRDKNVWATVGQGEFSEV